MADGSDYREVLDNIIRGAKVGGAIIGEGVLAAAGAHPGIDNPDSTFSLIDMARGKSEKGAGLGSKEAPRPEGARSMDEILSEGKGKKKGGKGKLAKAALSALGGGALPPLEVPQYMPTSVAFSPVTYTGGRPTRTKEEYAKDLT